MLRAALGSARIDLENCSGRRSGKGTDEDQDERDVHIGTEIPQRHLQGRMLAALRVRDCEHLCFHVRRSEYTGSRSIELAG